MIQRKDVTRPCRSNVHLMKHDICDEMDEIAFGFQKRVAMWMEWGGGGVVMIYLGRTIFGAVQFYEVSSLRRKHACVHTCVCVCVCVLICTFEYVCGFPYVPFYASAYVRVCVCNVC